MWRPLRQQVGDRYGSDKSGSKYGDRYGSDKSAASAETVTAVSPAAATAATRSGDRFGGRSGGDFAGEGGGMFGGMFGGGMCGGDGGATATMVGRRLRLRCLIRTETQTASVLTADAVCFDPGVVSPLLLSA